MACTDRPLGCCQITGKIRTRRFVVRKKLDLLLTFPLAFRDQLFKFLEPVPEGDFDALINALDTAGNTLDYRRYSDQLFEIYFTGGLLAPGGSYLDETPLSNHSVFAAKSTQPQDVRPYVVALEKVIRREFWDSACG